MLSTAYLEDELYELIRQSRSTFRFMQRATQGIWLWDLNNTDSRWFSPVLIEVLGTYASGDGSAEQDNRPARLFKPDDEKLMRALNTLPGPADDMEKGALRTRTIYPGDDKYNELPSELRFHHAQTGTLYYFDACYLIFYTEAGVPYRLLCGLQPPHSEAAEPPARMQKSASMLRAMASATQDAIIMMDNDGYVTFWNPAAENLFGYSSEEIIGQNLHKILAPERYHAEFYKSFPEYKETGRGEAVNNILELQARHKSGREIPVELSLSPVNLGEHRETIGILRDISARRRAQTELRKLSKAVEQSPASILITDPDGTIEYVNQKFVEITGYSRQEAIGKNPRMLKSGAQLLPFYEDLWGTITSGKTWRGELKNKRKDGSYYWESASITPIMGDDGHIINYLGIKEDITKRKQSEKALRKSEERYRSIIAVSNTGAWEYDSRAEHLWYSREYFEMLGFKPEEIASMNEFHSLKKAWVEFIHPEERAAAVSTFQNFLKHAMAKGAIYENTFRMRHKTGHWVWIWSRGTALRNAEGSYGHKVLGTHINITESKLAEQRIKESDLYHRSLLKTIPDMMFVMDKDARYLDFKASEESLFMPPEDFINKTATDVMPPEIAKQQVNAVKQALETRKVIEFEYSLPYKDKHKYFKARIVAFGEDKVIALATDITKSVQNLNRIKALLSAEEAQKERLKNFTQIVSHNLRNHTANMKGLFFMIEGEQPKLLEAPYIGMLKQASDKLNDTIDHLGEVLNLSLNEAEVTEPVSAYEALESGIKSIAQLIRKSGITVYNRVPGEVYVRVVPAYFESIVLNMLTNAIRFRAQNRTPYIAIDAAQAPDQKLLHLRFSDNGLGINLKRHGHKLFGMYKTFHNHPDSNGLGLFMSKHQAEAMGGKIEVESEVGRGTTFTVSLPLAELPANDIAAHNTE